MGRPNSVDTSLLRVPQYYCDFEGCRKYFSKLSHLKYHQNVHLAEKPYKCAFEGCTSAYYRPNHLKRHVDSIHKPRLEDSKDHKCLHEGCKASFDSESGLYFHTKRKHCAEPLKCTFCDKKFSKKWKIKEHEAGHTGAFPFKCEFEGCTEEFKSYMSFKAHKRKHEKMKMKDESIPCPAEGCQETFKKWSELAIHKKDCHPIETVCKICNKSFTLRNLKLHLPIHSEKRQIYPCTVEGCPRFYLHQKNLTHHVKVKHDGNGFNCSLCDKKLSTKQKLLQHVDIIHTRKPAQKKKRKSNLLSKLKSMSNEDWELKKTGPPRYERRKYNFIAFPDSGILISSQPVNRTHHEDISCEASTSMTSTSDSNGTIPDIHHVEVSITKQGRSQPNTPHIVNLAVSQSSTEIN